SAPSFEPIVVSTMRALVIRNSVLGFGFRPYHGAKTFHHREHGGHGGQENKRAPCAPCLRGEKRSPDRPGGILDATVCHSPSSSEIKGCQPRFFRQTFA